MMSNILYKDTQPFVWKYGRKVTCSNQNINQTRSPFVKRFIPKFLLTKRRTSEILFDMDILEFVRNSERNDYHYSSSVGAEHILYFCYVLFDV